MLMYFDHEDDTEKNNDFKFPVISMVPMLP